MIEFLLATAGLTYIVTQSSIFHAAREVFRKNPTESSFPEGFVYGLLSCPLCFGFWSGAFMWMLQGGEFGCYGKTIFIYACIGSIFSYAVHLVFSVLKKL